MFKSYEISLSIPDAKIFFILAKCCSKTYNVYSGSFGLPGEMLQQTETLNFVALQKEVTLNKVFQKR
jgi:hypothetical protein